MSGGRSAISGFDYQATVALDLLISHFTQHRDTATVRPEGIDDLDLTWTETGRRHRRFVQIKKPRQNILGQLKNEPWTTADAISELFPHGIDILRGNSDHQVWILGDAVAPDLADLLEKGPESSVSSYVRLVHAMAWKRTEAVGGVGEPLRAKLRRWTFKDDVPGGVSLVIANVTEAFVLHATALTLPSQHLDTYRSAVADLHAELPAILQRISIRSTFGSEQAVAARVKAQLEEHYKLSPEVVEFTLFRNLRGFINDISKQPDKSFDAEEFEFELISVWPLVNPIKELSPSEGHVPRTDLVRTVLASLTKAVEVTGISGSGKTSLAYEIKEQLALTNPDQKLFYSEVRSNGNLRQTLVGMAYHLRRMGMIEPFAVATDPRNTNELVLATTASILASSAFACTLLIDLVDGVVDLMFYRDLAAFVRALSSTQFKIIVFGHVKAFQGMTELERTTHGVAGVAMDGLNYELFARLVRLHQKPEPEPAAIWSVFQQVTSNRSTGIEAALAYALAHSASMEVMLQLARQPADAMLPNAERSRFSQVSDSCRRAGEFLTCFILPFRIEDSELIFATENVRQAIHELLKLGLLRADTDGFLEMHETVRAGLETTIAVATRRDAHLVLAQWYGDKGKIGPQVLHLEKAGRVDEAHATARASFIQGKAWDELSGYVAEHRLVSANELIEVACGDAELPNLYLLKSLIGRLATPDIAATLLQAIQTHWDRFSSNYQWAMAMTGALVGAEPTMLHDLIELALSKLPADGAKHSVLDYISLGARQASIKIEARTMGLFMTQSAENKLRLMPLMLLDRRREILAAVFASLTPLEFVLLHSGANRPPVDIHLRLNNLDEAREFFAALPTIAPQDILHGQETLPIALCRLLWVEYHDFRAHARSVLNDPSAEDITLFGAIRVLLFLGEPGLYASCGQFHDRPAPLGALVQLIPMITDDARDTTAFEERIRDPSSSHKDCLHAVIVLAMRGHLTAAMFDMLRSRGIGENEIRVLQGIFFPWLPHDVALSLLEREMTAPSLGASALLPAQLATAGQMPDERATALLIQALSHPDENARMTAAVQLGLRRSSLACSHLKTRYVEEASRRVADELAISSVACKPASINDLVNDTRQNTTILWRCIAIGRLRAVSDARFIVDIALDPQQPWQTRRAAILAAGRLPFASALSMIAPTILQTPQAFNADRGINFSGHAVLIDVLAIDQHQLMNAWTRGPEAFKTALRMSLNTFLQTQMIHDAPAADESASYVLDYVSKEGASIDQALRRLMEDLHLPMLQAAVLRSLRYCGQSDSLETALRDAYSPWLAMRALVERLKIAKLDDDDRKRIETILDSPPWSGFPRLKIALAERGSSTTSTLQPTSSDTPIASPLPTALTYDAMMACLRDDQILEEQLPPFVLEGQITQDAARLIAMLNPAEDPSRGRKVGETELTLGAEGYRLGASVTSQQTKTGSLRTWLRAAFSAQVLGKIDIPWHRELMASRWGGLEYRKNLIASLVALNDRDRFYGVIDEDDEIFVALLTDASLQPQMANIIDERIVPWLARYARAGTDVALKALCTLAGFVTTPIIDPILRRLLLRWATSAPKTIIGDPQRAAVMWHAFKQLTNHPRFGCIQGWVDHLSPLLALPVEGYPRQQLIEVLQRDPRAYVQIEKEVLRVTNFVHFVVDDLDRYDVMADQLFTS